ncbi:S-adenosylmethionine-dependent methyltransferase [Paenibacillus tyrfis]|uniref:methyltransferase domain-containing protein n=1 Tax=Paenibacillus tyrfis TaxID=1501230 RepID=UPI0024914A2E|nr:methyltransferase domain-containing protein [Paenibacillus tyrfis]GLI04161.1 S-adenosylmethionine-dependent methyltransferase [Paenibacillus tyrfis]
MASKTSSFSQSIQSYLTSTQMPWGQLFYATAWHQIDRFLEEAGQSILDIGCGFGITSLEYARRGNQVTGIDPTPEMIEIAKQSAADHRISIDYRVSTLQEELALPEQYDWIFCHNVLEYVEEPEKLLNQIGSKQNERGYLSLIAHNPVGKVMKKAVILKDPEEALHGLESDQEYSSVIETGITTYPYERLYQWLQEAGYEVLDRCGIHNIYGYIADNEIKQQEEWHRRAVKLELELGRLSPYRDIAVFTHLIARKKS